MTGRFDPLAELAHPDPSQLWFQIAEIFNDRTYLRHGIEVRPGDVVFDVGANAGVAAAFFAAECGAGRIFSFEPVPPNFEILSGNVGQFEACIPLPFGLSDRSGTFEFTYYEGASAMSGQYAEPERDRDAVMTVLRGLGRSEEEAAAGVAGDFVPSVVSCELRTLSSVVGEFEVDRIDLLKVDVERAELDVLQGIEDDDWPRIRQVVVEVHDFDGRLAEIRSLLEDRGFEVSSGQEENMAGTDVKLAYAKRAGE